jgi:hypothetical protein
MYKDHLDSEGLQTLAVQNHFVFEIFLQNASLGEYSHYINHILNGPLKESLIFTLPSSMLSSFHELFPQCSWKKIQRPFRRERSPSITT